MGRQVRLFLSSAVIIAAMAALAVFGLKSGGSVTGRRAPALPREHLGGPPATISSLLAAAHGKAALVVFWASWCPPCIKEAPEVERFATSPVGRGRIVGVDWSDGLSGARSFIRKHSWTFSTLRDGEGLVGNSYHMTGLPTTFVIDAKGHIRASLRGPQSVSSLQSALVKVEQA
jgi:cytochrome c biogenesis protein CcmG/thiol:disulfide interchange protein DsbE